jgi:tetratricopeptide (TPR) repeat protein
MLKEELELKFKQGLDALSRADFPEAIRMLEQVVVEDASNARAWRELGVSYLEIRQPTIALEALERSLSADPGDADTHYVLGSACGTLGQLERAAAFYRQALELNPAHAKAEEFLIRAESLLESREHYRRGLKLLYAAEPSVADLNQALRELVQSAAIFDGSPAAENLADCARKLLDAKREKTVSVEGAAGLSNWRRACERGYQCIAVGNWPGVRAAYEEALAFRASDAFVHHALGFSFLSLGETSDALRAWLRALELDASYDFSCFGRVESSTAS